jgi:hypothetical protein
MLQEVDPSEEAGVWTLCCRELLGNFHVFQASQALIVLIMLHGRKFGGMARFFVVGFLHFLTAAVPKKAAVENVPGDDAKILSWHVRDPCQFVLSRNINGDSWPSLHSILPISQHCHRSPQFISKWWNLLNIVLASLQSAVAIGAFLARIESVGTLFIFKVLRRVADAAQHGGRHRYGGFDEAGTVNYIARRYTASGFFCSYNSASR